MFLQVVQALFRLLHRRLVAGWHPPQRQVLDVQLLEELTPPPEDVGMRRVVREVPQRSIVSQTLKLIRIIGSPRTRIEVELPSSV